MQDIPSLTTLTEAEQWAASLGYRVSPKDREAIQKAQEAEKQRLRAVQADSASGFGAQIVQNFNRLYPSLLDTLIGIGDVLLTLTQTLIVAFGIPVILVLLLFVEQQRVVYGISLFETDTNLAAFAAWALVLLNLVLEIAVVHIEDREGYLSEKPVRFSLRDCAKNLTYTLGIGENWQTRGASPAQRYHRLLRLITFTILALALTGSMREVIAQTEGTWYAAIASIFQSSNLTTMMTWVGGLMFAMAAVLSAQALSRYVGLRTVETKYTMSSHHSIEDEGLADQLDQVGAQYIIAKVSAAEARRAGKEVSEVMETSPFSQNGQKVS